MSEPTAVSAPFQKVVRVAWGHLVEAMATATSLIAIRIKEQEMSLSTVRMNV
jgi:hypothetical protein